METNSSLNNRNKTTPTNVKTYHEISVTYLCLVDISFNLREHITTNTCALVVAVYCVIAIVKFSKSIVSCTVTVRNSHKLS